MAIANERRYWTVGRAGRRNWQVRYHDIDDIGNYELVEELGSDILTAAIEFDGDFVLPEQREHFQEITEQVPWLFVVDNNRVLTARKVNQPASAAVQLATDVVQVSACRGFRSVRFEVDMGLCVCYLKSNGTAYYRLREPINDTVQWNFEEQITAAGSGNTSIQAVRLIDFRLGIYVAGCNKLFISEREYIGNTMKSEYLYSMHVEDFDFETMPFRNVEENPTDPIEVTSFRLIDPYCFELTCNYPIFDFDPTWNDISLTGNYPADQSIDRVEWRNGKAYIYMTRPITSILTQLHFKLRSYNRKGYYISEQCKPLIPELTFGIEPGVIDFPEDTVTMQTGFAATPTISTTEIVERPFNQSDSVTLDISAAITIDTTEIITRDVEQDDSGTFDIDTLAITIDTTQVGETPI